MSEAVVVQPRPPEAEPVPVPPARKIWPRPLAIALIAGLLIAAAVVARLLVAAIDRPPSFSGGEYTPARAAPPLDLTDQNGAPFSLADQAGNVVLIYFGYTTCPDLCPTTLSDFQVVKDELGAEAGRTRFVLATVDPERDTVDRLKEYLAFFDPDFVGLRGDAAQTAAFERAYGITVKRVDYPDSATGYLLDHNALIYVIDASGNLRLSYPYGADPTAIADDVRVLLRE